jgi:hypothetical protein
MTAVLLQFAKALALTVAVETGVAWWLGLRTTIELQAVLLVNLLTNPLLNYLLLLNSSFHWLRPYIWMGFLEVSVVLAEWMILAFVLGRKWPPTLALSTALNVASLALGMVLL